MKLKDIYTLPFKRDNCNLILDSNNESCLEVVFPLGTKSISLIVDKLNGEKINFENKFSVSKEDKSQILWNKTHVLNVIVYNRLLLETTEKEATRLQNSFSRLVVKLLNT